MSFSDDSREEASLFFNLILVYLDFKFKKRGDVINVHGEKEARGRRVSNKEK